MPRADALTTMGFANGCDFRTMPFQWRAGDDGLIVKLVRIGRFLSGAAQRLTGFAVKGSRKTGW